LCTRIIPKSSDNNSPKKNEKIKRQYLDERFYNLFNVTHIGIIDFDNNY